MNKSPIVIALDYPDTRAALELLARLRGHPCRVKIGKELFTRAGPALVERVVSQGFEVFLDLKYHDIPNTVARACRAAADLGVWMINVHTLGGPAMLDAARDAVAQSERQPLLVGVTLLTSMGEADLSALGMSGGVAASVQRLARLAHRHGLDGVVCSPLEIALLRADAELGREFCLVTPGIRPAAAALDDQQRVMTPAQALAAGSNYLVIGRPITQAPDPLAALSAIEASLTVSDKDSGH